MSHKVSGNWSKFPKLNEIRQNLIYIRVFYTQNLVKHLPGSVTAHGFDTITLYIIFNLVFQTDSFQMIQSEYHTFVFHGIVTQL